MLSDEHKTDERISCVILIDNGLWLIFNFVTFLVYNGIENTKPGTYQNILKYVWTIKDPIRYIK